VDDEKAEVVAVPLVEAAKEVEVVRVKRKKKKKPIEGA
jgi:hypothetical protein